MKELAERARAQEAQAGGIPGRLVGDLQSRHVRRARILGHHQSAACDHPGGRRRAPAGGRARGRRRRLRQRDDGDALVRSSRGRWRARAPSCWRRSAVLSSSRSPCWCRNCPSPNNGTGLDHDRQDRCAVGRAAQAGRRQWPHQGVQCHAARRREGRGQVRRRDRARACARLRAPRPRKKSTAP